MRYVCFVCQAISRFFHRFSKKKNILLIKDDGVGDLIFWLPYQQEVRKHFPPSRYVITAFVNPAFAPLIRPFADRILRFPPYRNKLQWALVRFFFWSSHHYDMIWDFTTFPPETRPRYEIFPPDEKSFSLASFSSVSLPAAGNLKGYFRHFADVTGMTIHERNQAILAGLGISEIPPEFDYGMFCAPFPGTPEPKSYFVVCAGANDPRRTWETAKFVRLIDLLQKTYDLTAVLVGSRGEQQVCETIRLECENPSRVLNLAGRTSILQLFSAVRDAHFLIANETGTCHIGAVLGIRTFIICGLGDFGSFVPYPDGIEGVTVHSVFSSKRRCAPCRWQNEQCRQKEVYPCISDISVEEVFSLIRSRVSGGKGYSCGQEGAPSLNL